jgi:hypothetical protein
VPDPKNWKIVEGGEMQVRIGHDRTTVFIDFGKNVSAFKISVEQALAFAEKIKQQAIEARIGV